MNNYLHKSKLLAILCVVGLMGCSSTSNTTRHKSDISQNIVGDRIELTVAASKVKLRLPKMGLVKQDINLTASRRYFNYADAQSSLHLSGWFEPQIAYKGIQNNWQTFVKHWPGEPFENVTFTTIKDWEYVSYIVPLPNCHQVNLKAHALKQGTWIELHLSGGCQSAGNDDVIVDYLKQVEVLVK
jgi:hypothetical protein